MSTSASGTEEEKKLSSIAERFVCRRFSLSEIQLATENFSDSHVIGKGGFGKVYKGLTDDGKTVAIKQLDENSRQGEHEFTTEIDTLSKVRHVNLVSLIGYCYERGERIIVYEYIARGNLAEPIYKRSRNTDDDGFSSLTWKQRLNICIGAGQGLAYLHTGTSIIHRDVKSTNILLDENLRAKVSDFGLAKHLTAENSITHVTTDVKGTRGYLDPSYFHTHRLTKESDTYAFGVVLLEVLSGRAALDQKLGEDEMSLVMWAKEKIRKGKEDQIVASNLKEEISSGCLKTFVGVAKRCLLDEPKERPTMDEVVAKLKVALEQQEKKPATHNALWFRLLSSFWNIFRPSGYCATGSTKKDKKQVDVKMLSGSISTTQQEALMVEKKDEQNVGSYATGSTKKDEKQVDVNTLSATISTTQEEALMVEIEDEQNVGDPWILEKCVAPDRALDPAVLSRLKQFSAMNKLKKMALRVIAERLSEEEIAGLKEMFKAMDTDNSGTLTFDEPKAGLRKYGSTFKETEILDLMDAAAIDNSGTIDYEEFIAATIHLNKLEHEDLLSAAFHYFDKDESGYITFNELQQACVEHVMDDVFAEDIMREFDQDNDGRIGHGEFVATMPKGNGGVGRSF